MTTHKAGGSYGKVNGKEIFIPDVRFYAPVKANRLSVIEGDRHSLAVLDASGMCIGWMLAADVATSERPTLDTNTDDEVTRVS